MFEKITFVNNFGEALGPFLIAIRATGFFEAYVYLPVMTIISLFLFARLYNVMPVNGTFDLPLRYRLRHVIIPLYYLMCFFVTNAFVVAIKTLILEEMDYTDAHWFIPYVSYLHFYITSVALAFVYLVFTNKSNWISRFLCIHIQIGFVGAYWIGLHRILNEEWVLSDPTSGLSGFYLAITFMILNADLAFRFFRPLDKEDDDILHLFGGTNAQAK